MNKWTFKQVWHLLFPEDSQFFGYQSTNSKTGKYSHYYVECDG